MLSSLLLVTVPTSAQTVSFKVCLHTLCHYNSCRTATSYSSKAKPSLEIEVIITFSMCYQCVCFSQVSLTLLSLLSIVYSHLLWAVLVFLFTAVWTLRPVNNPCLYTQNILKGEVCFPKKFQVME